MSNSARPRADPTARAHHTETETDHPTEPTPLTIRLLDALEHTDGVAARATDEEYEFRVVAPMLIEVVNASYGPDARPAHTYTVTIADEGGLFVPIHCSCAFYQYRSDEHGACKHMVGAIANGGPPLLGAAAVYTGGDRRADADVTTLADRLGVHGDD